MSSMLFLSDDISSNIESSHASTAQATTQLAKASKLQKSSSSLVKFDQCTIFFFSAHHDSHVEIMWTCLKYISTLAFRLQVLYFTTTKIINGSVWKIGVKPGFFFHKWRRLLCASYYDCSLVDNDNEKEQKKIYSVVEHVSLMALSFEHINSIGAWILWVNQLVLWKPWKLSVDSYRLPLLSWSIRAMHKQVYYEKRF